MTHLLKSLPLALLLGLAPAAWAQDTETTEGTEAPDPMALNMGEPDIAVGDIYLEGQHTDWEIRCIKSDGPFDPCQLYQLIDDGNGNPVAEINIFPILGESNAAAGATVITPLETLLTEKLAISIDGSAAKKYPFSWCSQIGCFSRIGLSAADLDGFRRGAVANVIIVPVAAPDQTVRLEISLSGFTAGYKALEERMQAAVDAAAAEQN